MLTETMELGAEKFNLSRPGASPKMPLRAWDAADEYLIDYTREQFSHKKILIANDQFGALLVPLAEQCVGWVTDSYCALQATALNMQSHYSDHLSASTTVHPPLGTPLSHQRLNALSPPLNSLDDLPNADVVAMKIPKTMDFLVHQIAQFRQANITTVLLAGMTKHVPSTLLDTLSRFGSAQRLPFRKKAMLIELQLNHTQEIRPSTYPKTHTIAGSKIIGHANVFGRDKLDKGSELMLQSFDGIRTEANSMIADLCCGTGVLGIQAAKRFQPAEIHFFDESYMAVASAQDSFEANELTGKGFFHWDDAMRGHSQPKFDLVLCNPPFHEQHTVGDHIAWRLFQDAKQHLKIGGSLVIVGNRHLAYHIKLKRLFGNCEQINANKKFVVLKSKKQHD